MPFLSLFCHKFVIRKFILSFLSLVMETNSFTRLKLRIPISDLKLKNGLLSEPITLINGVRQGCPLSYCSILLFYITFFLKSYNTSDFKTIRSFQLKDKLFKKPGLIRWVIQKRIDKSGQMVCLQFSIKMLRLHFGNSVLDNSDWDKRSHSLAKTNKKNQYENYVQLCLR